MDDRHVRAKQLFDQGLKYQAIADELGVSLPTIKRWAGQHGWTGIKQATNKVTPIISKPKKLGRSPIDELEVVDKAIATLSTVITQASGANLNSPGLGSICNALVRLLEYRRRICPPTAAEFADQLLAANIDPVEFAAQVRERWRLQA